MKVTFCIHDRPNYVSGPTSWLTRLLPELQKRGVEVRVLALIEQDSGSAVEALRASGLTCLEYRQCYTEDTTRWLLEQLAEDPPDVFVPHCFVPAFYAARWVREAGIPTVGVMHSDDPFYRAAVNQFVFGEPAYRLSVMACVSRFLEDQVQAQMPEDTMVCWQPCGAPLSGLTAPAPESCLRLVYAGRLIEHQKCISEVARALCRAVREVPGTQAVLYGSGSGQAAVEKILAEAQTPAGEDTGLSVTLGGRVDSDRMPETLSHAHAFVLLSDYEGLPIALMEAMGSGVVPICTRIRSGIPELVEDGVTGLLVDDRGDAFVAAVRRLREEAGLWERLSQAAQGKIIAQYTNETCAMRWESMLRELASASTDRRPISVPSRLKLPSPAAGYPAWADSRKPSVPTRLLKKVSTGWGRIRRYASKSA